MIRKAISVRYIFVNINLSAFWIPELTVTEVIHGTTYVVTGSYEGTENFVRKLERITSKKFAEKLEDSE